jgi:hypothetical protein
MISAATGGPVAFQIPVKLASIANRRRRRFASTFPRAGRLTAEDLGKDLSYEQDGSAARLRDHRDYGNRVAPSDRSRPNFARLPLPGSPLTRETRGDQEEVPKAKKNPPSAIDTW